MSTRPNLLVGWCHAHPDMSFYLLMWQDIMTGRIRDQHAPSIVHAANHVLAPSRVARKHMDIYHLLYIQTFQLGRFHGHDGLRGSKMMTRMLNMRYTIVVMVIITSSWYMSHSANACHRLFKGLSDVVVQARLVNHQHAQWYEKARMTGIERREWPRISRNRDVTPRSYISRCARSHIIVSHSVIRKYTAICTARRPDISWYYNLSGWFDRMALYFTYRALLEAVVFQKFSFFPILFFAFISFFMK